MWVTKLWSMPSHAQLRWMISNTAAPGGRKGVLARLEVCTETYTPVEAITSSCSLKGVPLLNSTTRTCSSGGTGQRAS